MTENNEINEPQDGGALRKQLEKVLADNKALTEKLTGFEVKERTRSVESFLSEKGLNPKLAKFVPAEDASDQTRLDAWIKDNSELFGAPAAQGEGDPGGGSSVPETEQSAWRQIQDASANGAQPVGDMSAAVAKLKGVRTDAELMDALKAYGL